MNLNQIIFKSVQQGILIVSDSNQDVLKCNTPARKTINLYTREKLSVTEEIDNAVLFLSEPVFQPLQGANNPKLFEFLHH